MGSVKHGGSDYRATVCIGCKRLQFVSAVGNGPQQALHPVGITGDSCHVGQRIGLAGKTCVLVAKRLAGVPSLAGLASFKEITRGVRNRHGSLSFGCFHGLPYRSSGFDRKLRPGQLDIDQMLYFSYSMCGIGPTAYEVLPFLASFE